MSRSRSRVRRRRAPSRTSRRLYSSPLLINNPSEVYRASRYIIPSRITRYAIHRGIDRGNVYSVPVNPFTGAVIGRSLKSRDVPNRVNRLFSSARVIGQSMQRAEICARRHERKEVLFATNRAGGGHKPPRYSQSSQVRC